jgi:hypothetical protein
MAMGSYHVFRGLRVEHITSEQWIAAMQLGPNQTVEDCKVESNNGYGVIAYGNLVFVRSTSNHNGRLGIALNESNSLLESSETSYNSWRYGPRWDAGGIKIVGNSPPTGNRIVRHTASYNNGIGIWFDTVGSGNVVEASVFKGNVFAALEFEAAAGPNWAINNVIVESVKEDDSGDHPCDGAGIIMYDANDTYIYNNTIADVSGAGIVIAGNERHGGVYYTANTQVFNNIIVDSGTAAVRFWVSGEAVAEPRVGSHHFDNNLYYGNPIMIIFPDVPHIYGYEYWSLAEWQANRGEDLNSLNEAPGFVRPSVVDFSLLTDSSAIDAGCDLTDVPVDISGRPRPQDNQHDIGAYECPFSGGCGNIFSSDFEGGHLLDW